MGRILKVAVAAVTGLIAATVFAQATDNGAAPPASGRVSGNAFIGSGTLASNGTPTTPVRIFRDGVASTCSAVKTYPGDNLTPGPYAYQTLAYTNSGPGRCVTITFSTSCTGGGNPAGTFLAAYNGAFVPSNLSTNYIGDTGSSPASGSSVSMALNLAQNQSITLMVGQTNPAATTPVNSCTFSVLDDSQVIVPAMSPASMAAMAGLIALLGFVFLRRRALQR